MREQFEKLQHIKEKLDGLIYYVRDDLYEAKSFSNPEQVADMHWVNGAWYAYQEQQKRIETVFQKMDDMGMVDTVQILEDYINY